MGGDKEMVLERGSLGEIVERGGNIFMPPPAEPKQAARRTVEGMKPAKRRELALSMARSGAEVPDVVAATGYTERYARDFLRKFGAIPRVYGHTEAVKARRDAVHAEIVKRALAGESAASIAKAVGYSRGRVFGILEEKAPANWMGRPEYRRELVARMAAQGSSATEIAKQTGLSADRVRRIVKESRG